MQMRAEGFFFFNHLRYVYLFHLHMQIGILDNQAKMSGERETANNGRLKQMSDDGW